jgi:O-antigen ligase
MVCALLIQHQFRPDIDTTVETGEHLVSTVDRDFHSNNQRIALWKKTVTMIRDNFFLGVGTGNWKISLPKYSLKGLMWNDMMRIFVRAHNDFLQVFAETGVFGFICFLGIFLCASFYAVRILKNRTEGIDSTSYGKNRTPGFMGYYPFVGCIGKQTFHERD